MHAMHVGGFVVRMSVFPEGSASTPAAEPVPVLLYIAVKGQRMEGTYQHDKNQHWGLSHRTPSSCFIVHENSHCMLVFPVFIKSNVTRYIWASIVLCRCRWEEKEFAQ